MFKYVSDISELSHNIIEKFVSNKNIAIDGTLGNGHDSDFLKDRFEKVYSFEIQEEPCILYKSKEYENVSVINDSHHKIKEYVNEPVDCIVYNLGFLPGGNKDVTTKVDTTLISIKSGLEILSSGGIMSIAIYIGHDEGKEEESEILKYVSGLPKDKFGVMQHKYINRAKVAPLLIIVEKK